MVFSSATFLFLFLPLLLAVHALVPVRLRNATLLVASLLFYAWGELAYVWVMLASIAFNYALGVALGRSGERRGRWLLAAGVAANLGLLGWFKYAGFAAATWNDVGLPEVTGVAPHLPLGISFFTFQALSYLVDVQRGHEPSQRRPARLALFISLFPQLIAGPIVRYGAIAGQLAKRRVDLEGFSEGARRFTLGLGKKVLIANTLAVPADAIFGLPAGELTPSVAWFGVAAYTLQIYFDFSGYSDMAIGLGRMFGFRLPENFDHPYASASIREFWRRWHITLSSWFRDYVYVPLGGNRGGALRTARNLVLVFLLCGLWHGAAWTFVAWGLFHGAFLSLERSGFGAVLARQPRWVAHVYTLAVVAVGWVFFRADSLTHALGLLRAMTGLQPVAAGAGLIVDFATPAALGVFALGILGAFPWWRRVDVAPAWNAPAMAAVLLACAVRLALGTYDPFIYFRF